MYTPMMSVWVASSSKSQLRRKRDQGKQRPVTGIFIADEASLSSTKDPELKLYKRLADNVDRTMNTGTSLPVSADHAPVPDGLRIV